MALTVFGFFLFLFSLIGILSLSKRQNTTEDYYLASRQISPLLVAVSAIATNFSGYVFIGQIGFIYTFGLHAIWITIGWKIGDFTALLFVHRKLRVEAEEQNAQTYLEALSKWGGGNYTLFRKIAALVSITFLCAYAAAQFNAGSKVLFVLFDINYAYGAIISACIIMLYSLSGGMRSSIWTDAMQAVVLTLTLVMLLSIMISNLGGIEGFINAFQNLPPNYMHLFPADMSLGPYFGPLFFVLGWVLGGLGTIGQPHIMSRFLTLRDEKDMWKTRVYYYSLSLGLSCLVIPIALSARLILGPDIGFDPELALPMLARDLLPSVLLGVFLAGVFAATLSTADSQILAASAALSNDLIKNEKNLKLAKSSLIFVIMLTLLISVLQLENVWNLVMLAWAAMASAFAPIVIILSLGGRISQKIMIVMMLIGATTMCVWRFSDFNDDFYAAGVGIFSSFIFYFLFNAVYRFYRLLK